jgi:predicted metalloendopeptidase
MKTLTIDGVFKKVTIAYEPKERVTRKQLTDLLAECLKHEKVYGKYCQLLRMQERMASADNTIVVNKEFLDEFRVLMTVENKFKN